MTGSAPADWERSANRVFAELKRQAEAQNNNNKQLADLQTALSTTRVEIIGRIDRIHDQVKDTTSKIGVSEVCREHANKLSKLSERVNQHADRQDERFKGLKDIWAEINKLRDWVKKVNDAGLIDQTEGRIRWSLVGIVGAGGGGVAIVVAEIVYKFIGR